MVSVLDATALTPYPWLDVCTNASFKSMFLRFVSVAKARVPLQDLEAYFLFSNFDL